eukprot:6191728-Pleurochrysis_carterae.AAC.2
MVMEERDDNEDLFDEEEPQNRCMETSLRGRAKDQKDRACMAQLDRLNVRQCVPSLPFVKHMCHAIRLRCGVTFSYADASLLCSQCSYSERSVGNAVLNCHKSQMATWGTRSIHTSSILMHRFWGTGGA